MTLKKVICQSTEELPHPLTSPKWTLPNLKSSWRCPRRERPWWCLQRCQETPQRRRQRRSPACGRAACSTPTLIFRGTLWHTCGRFKMIRFKFCLDILVMEWHLLLGWDVGWDLLVCASMRTIVPWCLCGSLWKSCLIYLFDTFYYVVLKILGFPELICISLLLWSQLEVQF